LRDLIFSEDNWSGANKLRFTCRLKKDDRQAVLCVYTRIPGGGENDFAPFVYDTGMVMKSGKDGLPPILTPLHWILNPSNRVVSGEIVFPETLDVRFYEEYNSSEKRTPLKLKVYTDESFIKRFQRALRGFGRQLRGLYGRAIRC